MFSRKQPDLNWENPRLRAEVYDVMRFWLESVRSTMMLASSNDLIFLLRISSLMKTLMTIPART